MKYNGATLLPPYECNPTATANFDECEYHLLTAPLEKKPCQCGLDGLTGYCQYPGQSEWNAYGQALRYIASKSNCHTTERHRLEPLSECSFANLTDIKSSLDTVYEFRNWPYIQASSKIKHCYDNFHPESAYNLRWASAVVSGASLSILVLVTSLFSY